MTGPANASMLPALKRIWTACFGDGGGYTDYIFSRLLTPESILVKTDGAGEPASMICMEPFVLRNRQREARGGYLFGVATLPEHQGRGFSTALLEEAHRLLSGGGAALSVLVPAGEALFGFYGARGYQPFAQVKQAVFRRGDLPDARCTATPAILDTVGAMRDAQYGDRAYVRWRDGYLRYIGGECRMLGGDVLRLTCGGETGYAVCYPAGSRVVVKELAVAEELLKEAAAAILAHFGKEECLVYLPADTPTGCSNKVLPFAMVRWYDKKKQILMEDSGRAPYIAHVLDD